MKLNLNDEQLRTNHSAPVRGRGLSTDERLTGQWFHEELKALTKSFSPRLQLLDCACETDDQDIALVRHGYFIQHFEQESSMPEPEYSTHQVNMYIPFRRCRWEDLSQEFDQRFDAVFCQNDLYPSRHNDHLVQSFRGIRSVLKDGGVFVIYSRRPLNIVQLMAGMIEAGFINPEADCDRLKGIYTIKAKSIWI